MRSVATLSLDQLAVIEVFTELILANWAVGHFDGWFLLYVIVLNFLLGRLVSWLRVPGRGQNWTEMAKLETFLPRSFMVTGLTSLVSASIIDCGYDCMMIRFVQNDANWFSSNCLFWTFADLKYPAWMRHSSRQPQWTSLLASLYRATTWNGFRLIIIVYLSNYSWGVHHTTE